MAKECTCPQCGHVNKIDDSTWGSRFNDDLGTTLAKTALCTAVGIATGGPGGIALAAFFFGVKAVGYAAGTEISCSNCQHKFKTYK